MNPMTNTKNIKKLSEQELNTNFKTSWHDQYKDSAWIFVGGLPYDLTEGDIICVFSQYGEIVNINLVRDKITGKQKGFCFICYEDQRSTVLAVDNLNSIKILNRTIRVDHVAEYKVPKEHKDADAETRKIQNEGCAPSVSGHERKPLMVLGKEPPPRERNPQDEEFTFDGIKLPERLPIGIKTEIKEERITPEKMVKVKKEKKSKKEKRSKSKKSKKKHRRKSDSSESNDSDSSSSDDNDSRDDRRKRKTHEKKPKNVLKSIYK